MVDAATAMTTDTGLDLSTMLRIAASLRGLSSRSVQFVQVPEVPYPNDPQAEVMFEQPQAGALFAAVAHDTALPGPARGERPRGGPRSPRAPASPPPASSLSRTYSGIQGSARACSDRAAFAGGDVPGDFTGG